MEEGGRGSFGFGFSQVPKDVRLFLGFGVMLS